MAPDGRAAPPGRQAGLVRDSAAPSRFSLKEVSHHSTPADCWIVVRGKVYDVSRWVPHHPGGPLIYVAAGKDCTQLFESYHPLAVSGLLPKFCVGELQLAVGEAAGVTEFQADLGEGQFYAVLKTRVEGYFKEHQLDPRVHPAMFVKSAVILLGLALSWYAAFFAFQGRLLATLLAAVLLGVCKAEVGVSIMHDANHGAYSNSTAFARVMGATLDVAGASSFMWRQQHVVGHHAFTNVDGLDPDIRVSEADVRRVTGGQPWHWWHSAQHLYLGLLYGLLAAKSTYLDDFAALRSGAIGAVTLARFTPQERWVFWGGKAFYAAYMLLLPALLSPHPWARLLCVWALTDAVTGWVLAFMFQVAHVVDDVKFPRREPGSGQVAMGWAAAQMAGSADFCHGSWFWTHFSGGLNYQVVHHLFPGICHCHYPALAPIVLRTAAEHGVPYVVYPTFASAVAAHFRQLRKVGAGRLGVPSLSTVG